MKKLSILAAVLVCLFATTVQADDDKQKKEFCGQIASLAKVAMTNRQIGVPMQKMIEAIAEFGSIKEMAEEMVMMAYGYPRYQTESIKKRTIEDFRDHWYLECIKGTR